MPTHCFATQSPIGGVKHFGCFCQRCRNVPRGVKNRTGCGTFSESELPARPDSNQTRPQKSAPVRPRPHRQISCVVSSRFVQFARWRPMLKFRRSLPQLWRLGEQGSWNFETGIRKRRLAGVALENLLVCARPNRPSQNRPGFSPRRRRRPGDTRSGVAFRRR